MIESVAILTAIIVGLSEILKNVGVKSKWIPVANLVMGVVFSFVFVDAAWHQLILTGIVVGLSASGFYDNSKRVGEEVKKYE